MDTYITLIMLSAGMIWFVNFLLHELYDKDYKNKSETLNKPLDNKNKWWYN